MQDTGNFGAERAPTQGNGLVSHEVTHIRRSVLNFVYKEAKKLLAPTVDHRLHLKTRLQLGEEIL